jgi:hypothetical protein
MGRFVSSHPFLDLEEIKEWLTRKAGALTGAYINKSILTEVLLS